MRIRVLTLACALGIAGVVGLSPQAHACISIKIGDAETKCVEDIVCDAVGRPPALCPLTS